ncbi:MAG: hypothetical protein FJX76_26330 [Armatimonadetes bacterium]|nr:hypothetical protein [Armatimonadota bacterium]
MLPATSPELTEDDKKPYFLWWSELTTGQFREILRSADTTERAYWIGALMREANTRDVWIFVSPGEIRTLWPLLWRHLGRSREMWSCLLKLSPPSRAA